ncbi:MAG: hypothetical protein U9N44_05150 [Chloroflexota bacterium]|nr:hypothetical protein [Chloroflexota bacterium]
MTIGIILLLVCIGSIVIVWFGLGGIEVNGALAAGLICILIGTMAISRASGDTAYFWVSLAFIAVGAVIFLSAIRSRKALKEFSAAICVAIAIICGFYAIHYLT